MSSPDMSTARFSVRAALGLWLMVLRRRPGAFLGVALVTLVLQASLTGLLTYAYAGIGDAFEQVSHGGADFNEQVLRASLISVVIPLVSFPLWFWLETVWLRLYNNEARPWALRWTEPGLLFLSYLVIFGIYFGGLIASAFLTVVVALSTYALMNSVSWMMGSWWVYLIAIPLILLPYLLLAAVLARFSALPALAVMRRTLDPMSAWRATKGAFWRTIAAWIITMVIYGVVIIGYVQNGKEWSPVLRAYWDMMAISVNPAQDPESFVHPYTAFAGLFDAPGAVFWLAVDALAMSGLYVVASAITRGIGVTLAWRAPVRAGKPSATEGADA